MSRVSGPVSSPASCTSPASMPSTGHPSILSRASARRQTTEVIPSSSRRASVMTSRCRSSQMAEEITTAMPSNTSTVSPESRSPSELHSLYAVSLSDGSAQVALRLAAAASRV
eukprot:scaffold102069_cov32-Tisochrysis_lutea.AAC.3